MNTHINLETEGIFNRFSSYKKIVRVFAWIYRFYSNSKFPETRICGDLTLKEIKHAELILLKTVQEESFPDDANDNRLKSLHPIIEDKGLLRVKTRIFDQKDKKNFRLPIILPSKHRIVHLLIESKRKELGHPGVQILMNKLRKDYWILQNRKTIRQVIMRCIQ